MLKIQEFLINGGTFETLEKEFGLQIKRHNAYNNLVLFRYSQIDSPMAQELVRECRGIILDEANGWNVVAFPFRKFFNCGEFYAAPIDWKTSKVQEKVDGTLCTLYHYDDAWRVATMGVPDASGCMPGCENADVNFHKLFWRTFNSMELRTPGDTNLNLMFEFTSPYNKVVIRHNKPSLTLVGARNRKTLQEIPVDEFKGTYPVVKSFSLQTIDDIIATFESLSPLKQEGYVVVDAQFNRVKVKHPGYVAIHHLNENFSLKKILEVVRHGEAEELISYFVEHADSISKMRKDLDALILEMERHYEDIKDAPIQKDFALMATKTRVPAALFAMRGKKIGSIKKYIMEMNIDKLAEILGVK